MLRRTRLSHIGILTCACHSLSVWAGVEVQLLYHIYYSEWYLPQKGFVGFLYKKNIVVLLLTSEHHRITIVNSLCFYFGPIKMTNPFLFHLTQRAVQAPYGMCFDKIEMSYKLFMTDEYQQVGKVLTKPTGLLPLKRLYVWGIFKG